MPEVGLHRQDRSGRSLHLSIGGQDRQAQGFPVDRNNPADGSQCQRIPSDAASEVESPRCAAGPFRRRSGEWTGPGLEARERG